MNEFIVGALVRGRVHGMKGTIIGDKLKAPLMVAIEWDDGTLSKESVHDLRVLNEAQEKAHQEIKAKVTEATLALEAANKLARENGTSLSDLYYDLEFRGLFDELDDAGWSSSSMHC